MSDLLQPQEVLFAYKWPVSIASRNTTTIIINTNNKK